MKSLISILLCLVLIFSSCIIVNCEERSVRKTETEPNNTYLYADYLRQDETVYGTISSQSDTDWYLVQIPLAGKLNVWMGDIPSNTDYDFYVFDESLHCIGSSTGSQNTEYLQLQSVSAGDIVYIRIESAQGYDAVNEYRFRVKLLLNPYACYCQRNFEGSTPMVEMNNVDMTYFQISGSSTGYDSWFDEMHNYGCTISSIAMLLTNLGKTTSNMFYDMRTKTSQILDADPISVSIVNSRIIGSPYITDDGINMTVTRSPASYHLGYVNSAYGTHLVARDLSGTEEEKANAIAELLVDHPEGVAVYFQKTITNSSGVTSTKKHMIVFVQTSWQSTGANRINAICSDIDDISDIEELNNIDEFISASSVESHRVQSVFNDKFTVVDPWDLNNNIPTEFTNTYSCRAFGFSSAFRVIYNDQ